MSAAQSHLQVPRPMAARRPEVPSIRDNRSTSIPTHASSPSASSPRNPPSDMGYVSGRARERPPAAPLAGRGRGAPRAGLTLVKPPTIGSPLDRTGELVWQRPTDRPGRNVNKPGAKGQPAARATRRLNRRAHHGTLLIAARAVPNSPAGERVALLRPTTRRPAKTSAPSACRPGRRVNHELNVRAGSTRHRRSGVRAPNCRVCAAAGARSGGRARLAPR